MSTSNELYARFLKAKQARQNLEGVWRDCYEFALPQREGVFSTANSPIDRLFDGTAPDSVDQLAASMLSELTPAWSRWFDLSAGMDLTNDEAAEAEPVLEQISAAVQAHFDKSSFLVEAHQCFLDLVTVGTACLLFEESPIGSKSAFKFTAVPLSEVYVEEGPSGRLDATYRSSAMTLSQIETRFGGKVLPIDLLKELQENIDATVTVIECVLPKMKGGYDYIVFLANEPHTILKKGLFEHSPFITFRWLKAPGEAYGRSPVMKALPDIKTANKVVELILKNATIAVTGIWQAEDDGVLNPANIRLVPGSIIPKAVGSKGLTPLEAAGNFDVSQLVLNDLRARIRHALLVDKLGQVNDPKMTATEVLERSAEMVRILGATYGRLQNEFLNPMIERALSILRRRGEIPEILVDGRLVAVEYRSPIARTHAKNEASEALTWLSSLSALGNEAMACLDIPAFVHYLAGQLNVPAYLLKGTDA